MLHVGNIYFYFPLNVAILTSCRKMIRTFGASGIELLAYKVAKKLLQTLLHFPPARKLAAEALETSFFRGYVSFRERPCQFFTSIYKTSKKPIVTSVTYELCYGIHDTCIFSSRHEHTRVRYSRSCKFTHSRILLANCHIYSFK